MRYFFHVHDGTDLPDLEGTELQDDDAAREEAMSASAEIIKDLGPKFWAHGEWQMKVVDEDERPVLTLWFRGEIQRH